MFKPETPPHSNTLRGTLIGGSARKTLKLRTPACVCWKLLALILLLGVGGCCLAFAKGGNSKKRCTELECFLNAIKLAVQLQGQDSDVKPEKIPKEES